jgi:hypothetical protein
LQSDDLPKNVGHVWARAWKRGAPIVALARTSCVKGRQIDMVDVLPEILHIEEGALPFLTGLLPRQLQEPSGLAGVEGGRPARHWNCVLSSGS